MLLKTSQKIVAEAQNKIVNALFICYMYTCIHIHVSPYRFVLSQVLGQGLGVKRTAEQVLCTCHPLYLCQFNDEIQGQSPKYIKSKHLNCVEIVKILSNFYLLHLTLFPEPLPCPECPPTTPPIITAPGKATLYSPNSHRNWLATLPQDNWAIRTIL